jgi:hypothetical protein
MSKRKKRKKKFPRDFWRERDISLIFVACFLLHFFNFCCMPYMACNFHIALSVAKFRVAVSGGERTSHVADS